MSEAGLATGDAGASRELPDAKTSAELQDSIWWQNEHGKKLGAESPMYGVNRWELNGFVHLRLHAGAVPLRHPTTPTGRAYFRAMKKDLPAYSFLQEVGIAYDVTPGRPVYCDTEKVVAKAQLFRPWLVLFRATDFGYQMPASVYGQVEEISKGGWRLRFLREMIGRNIFLHEFLDKHVVPDQQLYFPNANVVDVADPAGNARDDKSPETSMQVMNTRGIYPRWKAQSVDEGVVLFQMLISAGVVEIDPVGCRTLWEAVKSGYVRDKHGFPIKDGYYDHVADAARYLVRHVFRLVPLISGGQRINRVELEQVVATGVKASSTHSPRAAGGLERIG